MSRSSRGPGRSGPSPKRRTLVTSGEAPSAYCLNDDAQLCVRHQYAEGSRLVESDPHNGSWNRGSRLGAVGTIKRLMLCEEKGRLLDAYVTAADHHAQAVQSLSVVAAKDIRTAFREALAHSESKCPHFGQVLLSDASTFPRLIFRDRGMSGADSISRALVASCSQTNRGVMNRTIRSPRP